MTAPIPSGGPARSDDADGAGGAAGELALRAAQVLKRITGRESHDVALVLGSGWVPALDALDAAGIEPAQAASAGTDAAPPSNGAAAGAVEFPNTELPGFLPPAVEGHAGRIRSLELDGVRVLVFLGRTHLYEGRGVEPVVHGVRVAAAAGCRAVVLTNACGGLRAGLRPGDPVLLSDHLNLTARTPLVGARFVDLSVAYSLRLRELVREIDPSITEGVYAQFTGPQYETPAEVRMAGILGADVVGMSTVLETIAARAEGLEVLAIALVTNLAAGLGEPLDHEEVLAEGRAAATRMGRLLRDVLPRI